MNRGTARDVGDFDVIDEKVADIASAMNIVQTTILDHLERRGGYISVSSINFLFLVRRRGLQ
jgi:hypothetical protein